MADEIKDSLISEMFEKDGVSINNSITTASASKNETYINKDAEKRIRKGHNLSIEQIAKNNSNIFERAAREMAELERDSGDRQEDIVVDATKNPREDIDREDK